MNHYPRSALTDEFCRYEVFPGYSSSLPCRPHDTKTEGPVVAQGTLWPLKCGRSTLRVFSLWAAQEQRFRQTFLSRVFDVALPCTSREQHRAAESKRRFNILPHSCFNYSFDARVDPCEPMPLRSVFVFSSQYVPRSLFSSTRRYGEHWRRFL